MKPIVMWLKLLLCFTIIVKGLSDELESVEFDPILHYLLNGEYEESMPPVDIESEDPEVDGGLWKCGMCENLNKLRLIYSETNIDDEIDDTGVQQIEVSLPGLKCVIVRSSSSNIVRSVKGDCEGPSVTLTLAPTNRFILDVYGDDSGEGENGDTDIHT